MTPDAWRDIKRALQAALPLTGADREAYLQAQPAALRSELESLIRAYETNSAFLERPWVGAAPTAEAAEAAMIGKRFGPYRVLSLLGHGGMGSVWLAERVDGFSRQVALKLIHPALMGGVMTERLIRERQILASLSHPHIARLFDAGFAQDGQPYLALEYIAGTPITTHCNQHGLGIRERLDLFQQVLDAVQYAHAHLVIHRDLKPSNILVTADGQVQLLDFGIAKLVRDGEAKETELTQLGGRALTPDYAAPEQIAGDPITTAADVYGLGVILYELLTGERPYHLKRDSRGALEEAILQAEPLAPSRCAVNAAAAQNRATTTKKLGRTLRGDLDTITLKALKKSPSERYATANAFHEDIARYLRGDVVLAQPDSFAYRALKFARRHWIELAVTGGLIVTLAGGLTATSYEARIAAGQRDAALQAQMRSLTETAAGRLKEGDIRVATGIILEVLRHGAPWSYAPDALDVFQQARAADAQVTVIAGHTDRVNFAAFSPDGRRIVTASHDTTARIWDASTGREILQLRGHTGRVWSAVFSPDGRRVVTASFDDTARIWDAATGKELQRLTGHTDRVLGAAFSPDGRRIATASSDRTARIWDAATGRETTQLRGHTDRVITAVFAPDGRRVLTASFDKTARIWDAASGREMLRLSGHDERVVSAAFSPDGTRVVTTSYDKTARIWDAATGKELRRLTGHTATVVSAAFSPDGCCVVTSGDKTARIWDIATGRELMQLSGHTDRVVTAAFSPDGARIVTASDDKTARVWDAMKGRNVMPIGSTARLNAATFSPDGAQVVAASYDKTAHVLDAATARQLQLLSGHTDILNAALFSPDGRRIATASDDRTARIWDAATGQEVLRLIGHTGRVSAVAFSPDAKRIITGSSDKTGRIWDAASGGELVRLNGHADRLWSATFSPDGRRVLTASDDRTARIWDAATGRELGQLRGHTDAVWSAAFSPDGRRIATASGDATARLWDAATGREIMVLLGHAGRINTVVFSPDARRVLTGSDDRTARIWDADTGRLLTVLSGHTDIVNSAAFSRDGQHVVTASDDGSARIWTARVPDLDIQIAWAEAAQFDPLSSPERFKLGLPAKGDLRPWPAAASQCDAAAAAPYDPERRAPGAMLDQIVTPTAVAACAGRNDARSVYQWGRALAASANPEAARRAFERAIELGHAAARVDLARLLLQPSSNPRDVAAAIALYERASSAGLTVAAFELGNLYEHGVRHTGAPGEYVLFPDRARAWSWYGKAAAAHDPQALARFAERDDSEAFAADNAVMRDAHLLEAFKYYAAAAERARIEAWPDSAWKAWRYHRASIARVLEHSGMMQEVARAYTDVRRQYAVQSPTPWARFTTFF
jgi:WD40 repeat protein/serine/threonine protein kinase